MRKKGIFTATLIAVTAISIGSALAYFTAEDQVVNKFTVGTHKVELHETDWSEEDGDGKNMYPGYTVYKNPTIKNTASTKNGEQSAYARIYVEAVDQDGKPIYDSEALKLIFSTMRYDKDYTGSFEQKGQGGTIVEGRIPGYSTAKLKNVPNYNPDFVIDSERSYDNVLVFNYMGTEKDGILKSGEQAALFTAIVIPIDWTLKETELTGDFSLKIRSESIQSSGFASWKEAFAALDHPDFEDESDAPRM